MELRRLYSGSVFAAHLEDLIRVLLSRDLDNSQSLDVHGTWSIILCGWYFEIIYRHILRNLGCVQKTIQFYLNLKTWIHAQTNIAMNCEVYIMLKALRMTFKFSLVIRKCITRATIEKLIVTMPHWRNGLFTVTFIQ